MNMQDVKRELFQIRKAWSTYHNTLHYLRSRFVLSRSILRYSHVLEKSETAARLSMHVMLGHPHVIMALWSLGSYYAVARDIGRLFIHSDGTLTDNDRKLLVRFFPHATVIDPTQVLARYRDAFDRFPRLKAFRLAHRNNFFLTKLIDPWIVSERDIRLIFDIDVLWYKNSDIISHVLEEDHPHSFMMTGIQKEQGSHAWINTVYFKDGSSLPPAYTVYNGGIMLYHKDNMPEERLSDYVERVDMTRPESQHWIEQSGYASVMQDLQVLPPEAYTIKGKVGDAVTARHYTGPRRVEFYTEGLPKAREILWNTT